MEQQRAGAESATPSSSMLADHPLPFPLSPMRSVFLHVSTGIVVLGVEPLPMQSPTGRFIYLPVLIVDRCALVVDNHQDPHHIYHNQANTSVATQFCSDEEARRWVLLRCPRWAGRCGTGTTARPHGRRQQGRGGAAPLHGAPCTTGVKVDEVVQLVRRFTKDHVAELTSLDQLYFQKLPREVTQHAVNRRRWWGRRGGQRGAE